MNRYVYSYRILSTGETSRYGVPAATQDEADAGICEAIADIEFTEPEDVQDITLDRIIEESDNYYECEGCT
ncbi:hypothetical protein [Salibacterium halotolerans]|uniref:Uncharacterized protein n=1 Tax=Salibacterium halotolerans TaxID=1884432 RepID=A0A1I5MSI1_9BACI|nr:hypothetical protein [Salibacterium halotolerans]SFP11946.1 hypothetical protein SAMN05518683_102311 [Salibacterium halotolerans]